MKRKAMRLLILGDDSVGKTSLVSAMMYDNQPNQVKKLNKVSLSPERCIYSKDIFTELIDTDVESDINQEILLADIILLVYDISEQSTITRIETHWLPIISTIRSTVPVILVGNKLDKKELEMSNKELEYINVRSVVKSLVKKYRQVQMGFECSAYYDRNVKKVLNAAQRAVLYPLSPLYDLTSKQLTPKFKKAIMRIFRILDKDLDGKLTDNELRSLQQKVFQTDLNGDDIKTIKEIILRELQEFNEDHIKLNGFYALQKKCIEMLKIQICWSILRHFDYNDQLQISHAQQDFIYDQTAGQSLQLSLHAVSFLERIYTFSFTSKAQDETPMHYLFSCSPCIPLEQFKSDNISLERFLLAWSMYAFLDYKECYRSLLYIGYEDGLETVFKKVRAKTTYNDLLKLKERKIFTILIIENQHDKYGNYLELLFKKGVTFSVENYIQRAGFLFSQDNKQSKVMLLLKVHQRYLEEFVQKNPLKKRIDLVLTFENNSESEEFSHIKIKTADEILNFARQKFSGHTMFRKFNKKQTEQFFNSHTLPVLNLQSLPIQYKEENWQPLFSQMLKTFEKLQVGYSLQKLERLKKQNEKLNKIWTGVGILGVTVLGCLALKKNPMSFIKELK